MLPDPTQRFSDRVANYIRYRPSYPPDVIDLLRQHAGLSGDSIVADVGSGTGIATELLLNVGCTVFAIEPNDEMRAAAEGKWRTHPCFHSLNGTAEATTLPDHGVDLIVAAQAFHWFDQAKARREFDRILKPNGSIALLWNARHLDTTPFLRGYEALLQSYATDYGIVRHEHVEGAPLKDFFFQGEFAEFKLPNAQKFDFEGVKGRLLSSSYAPTEEDPRYGPMLVELQRIFDLHQNNGRVSFDYDTRLYLGR